jgi:predicted nucleic acid-binding protein
MWHFLAATLVLGHTVIAATAYLNDYSLVTNNAKDYPMPELKLYKHTQEKAA